MFKVCMPFKTFVPSEPPKWLSIESWDSQFKKDIGDFSKLKTWTGHLNKLSLDTVQTYKDAQRVPKWFRILLAQEFAKRTRPSLWARFSAVYTRYKTQIKQWAQAIRDESNPIGLAEDDTELQRFQKILAYVRVQMQEASTDKFVPAEALNGTMTGDAGEDDSLLVSFIAYMINFGMSYVVWKWLTQSDYDDDEELHDDATWWAMIAANMLS